MMESQIKKAPKFNRIICMYTVYPKDKRQFDLGNVCCIHQKFFEDALVELGKLPDDNKDYIPLVLYHAGHIDKDNPRVEVEVMDYNKEGIEKVIDILYNEISKMKGGNQ